jgi:hypothetical protein
MYKSKEEGLKLSSLSGLSFAAIGLFVLPLSQAHAQVLVGSLPLAGNSVTQDGTTLATSTEVTAAFAGTSGPGVGDYAPIPSSPATDYFTLPLLLATPESNNPVISNPLWGAFTASTFTIVTHTATNYDVELFGVYTPGPSLIAADGPRVATDGELRVSINQSGTSLSEAITLSTPPADVPEPGSVAMLASVGIMGASFLVRRRK